MAAQNCPNCSKPYQPGDEVCRYCGFAFPFSTGVLPSSTLLHGRYEIQQLLHSGGMGFVYLAKDKNLFDRLCVVKQVRERLQSKENQEKVEEEALRMAKLNHPNVAMILDHFVENGYYFLVVENIRGKTLSEVFEENGGILQEAEVLKWAKIICDVLIYLHSEGVIHRDISPDNIMLTSDGTIKFIDFGTLRELSQVTTDGTAGMGKFGFSPPEQWQGRPEPRSDIFALGATLYFLLTGFLPHSKEYRDGEGPQRADFYPEFPPIRKLNPRISSQFENVLQKALNLEINNRYDSAVDMRRGFDNIHAQNTMRNSRNLKAKFPIKLRGYVIVASVIILGIIGGVTYYLISDIDRTNTIGIVFGTNYDYIIHGDSFENALIPAEKYWNSQITNLPADSAGLIIKPVSILNNIIPFDYQNSSSESSYTSNPPKWTFADVPEEQDAEVNVGLYPTANDFTPGFDVERSIYPNTISGDPTSKFTLTLTVTVTPQPGNDDMRLMDISVNTFEDNNVAPSIRYAVYNIPPGTVVNYFNVRSNGIDLGIRNPLNGSSYQVIITIDLILKNKYSNLTYMPHVVVARSKHIDGGTLYGSTISREVKEIGTWTWSVSNDRCVWHWNENISGRVTLQPRTTY